MSLFGKLMRLRGGGDEEPGLSQVQRPGFNDDATKPDSESEPFEFVNIGDDEATLHASVMDATSDWSKTGRGVHVEFEPHEAIPLLKGRMLGRGAMGDVCETNIQGYKVAWKTITFRRKLSPQQRKEIDILKTLSHTHVIQLVGTYTHRLHLGILLYPVALCDLHTFFEDVEAYSTSSADHEQKHRLTLLNYPLVASSSTKAFPAYNQIGCLVSAITYLHNAKVRHKDLKPSNILLSPNQIWLSDFGSATDFSMLSHSATNSDRGTPRYFAPEVADWQKNGRAADIFSLGCVLAEILVLHEDGSRKRIEENRSGPNPAFHANLDRLDRWVPFLDSYSPRRLNLVRVVREMLSREPQQRPTAHELLQRFIAANHMAKPRDQSIFGPCCHIQTVSITAENEQVRLSEDRIKEPGDMTSAPELKSHEINRKHDEKKTCLNEEPDEQARSTTDYKTRHHNYGRGIGPEQSLLPENYSEAQHGSRTNADRDDKPRERSHTLKSAKIASSNSPSRGSPVVQFSPRTSHSPPSITIRMAPNESAVVESLSMVYDHTTDQLTIKGDEYVPREVDEAGELKVMQNGSLLGNREYRCPIATQTEKDDLINQDIVPYSHRFGQIVLVTARSMFRQFGSKLIVNGTRVQDDYWESKARQQTLTKEDEAEGKHPGAGKKRAAAAAKADDFPTDIMARAHPGAFAGANADYMGAPNPLQPSIDILPASQNMLNNELRPSNRRSTDPQHHDHSSVQPLQHKSVLSQGTARTSQFQNSSNATATEPFEVNRQLDAQRKAHTQYLDDVWNLPHETPLRSDLLQYMSPKIPTSYMSQRSQNPARGYAPSQDWQGGLTQSSPLSQHFPTRISSPRHPTQGSNSMHSTLNQQDQTMNITGEAELPSVVHNQHRRSNWWTPYRGSASKERDPAYDFNS
ncbi:hypothetical protein OPT61_g571 [Boeremia exigua]|uniref:Uncharacterized protein n=1 Tax=Boeremia exigua TaxID=749465 RepID=A0ACC2ITJ0_9PLEO|nr:hypothetical protein OPT61_g571 [Boeremia exigua]